MATGVIDDIKQEKLTPDDRGQIRVSQWRSGGRSLGYVYMDELKGEGFAVFFRLWRHVLRNGAICM